MTKLKSIYLALLNRGEKIMRKKEIVKLVEDYNNKIEKISITNAIWYLSRQNYIKRIFLGYYYINSYDEKKRSFCNYSDRELIFSILNKEKVRWYLGLNTAIYEQGKTWQTPNRINIINTRISGRRKIVGLNVKFIKIKEDLVFGLKELKTNNKVPYFYSDPAKTYIDMVYFKQVKVLTRVKNTQEYLKRYPKWVGKK